MSITVIRHWWSFAEEEGGTTYIEMAEGWSENGIEWARGYRSTGPDCDGTTTEHPREWEVKSHERAEQRRVQDESFDWLLYELGGCVYTGQPLIGSGDDRAEEEVVTDER